VAPLWDTRESYRASDPAGLYARLHHKMRIYVLGGRVHPAHVFFSSQPLVGSKNCTFKRLHRLPRWARRLALLSRREREALGEDVAFWRRPSAHAELMVRAVRALGLDFAAVDFSVRADGSAMLWEANPYPSLPPLAKQRVPELRHGRARMESHHRAIGDFLLGLLSAHDTGRACIR
jgi:hypothetical protein